MSITQAVTNSKGPSSPGSRLNVHYITNRKSVLKVPCGSPPHKKRKEVCERMHSVNPVLQTGKNKIKSPNLNRWSSLCGR